MFLVHLYSVEPMEWNKWWWWWWWSPWRLESIP